MATVKKFKFKCSQCGSVVSMLEKRPPKGVCSWCPSTKWKYIATVAEVDVPAGECPVLGRTAFVLDGLLNEKRS